MTPDRLRVLEELEGHLWTIGSANDAVDHGYQADADRMRTRACDGVRDLLAKEPWLEEALPRLREELSSGRILVAGWSSLSEAAGALRAGGGR